MAAVVAEDAMKQPARPVHDGGLFVEVGGARHEARHGEDPGHAIEGAELVLEHGQRVERAHLGRLGTLFHRDVRAQRAHARELAVDARQLTRRPGHITVHDDGVERVVGRMGTVQRQSE